MNNQATVGKELAGSVKSSGSEAAVENAKTEKKRVRNYKGYTRKLISEEFPEIVRTIARKCVEGSLAHIKYLFDLGGVKEDIERQGSKIEPSVAEVLLGEIRRQQAARAAKANDGIDGNYGLLSAGDESGEDFGARGE